jgi:GNAT superfamily N-acetyltransferase
MGSPNIEIVDVIRVPGGEQYLYKCLAPHPFRRYRKRARYLEEAIPRGLRKEILLLDGSAVGMIEHAPAGASGYPIFGPGVWVMNCIWVLRKAKGNRFGKTLMERMFDTAGGAEGYATIALEGHPSPWLRLRHMEYLGFRSIDSRRMRHKVKRPEVCFTIHLMWMPVVKDAEPPAIDWEEMMKGVDFCIAHPLYNAEGLGLEVIFEEC